MLTLLTLVGLVAISSACCLGLLKFVFSRSERQWLLARRGDLLWVVGAGGYYGPCCPDCLLQYATRPIFRLPGEPPWYELVCPVCRAQLAEDDFTILDLIALEWHARKTFAGQRLGTSLLDSCVAGWMPERMEALTLGSSYVN